MGNLITETIFDTKTVLEEGADGVKRMYITGPYIQCEVKNRNGRMYPLQIIEKELGRYNRDFVSQNRALGELNHPTIPTVNLERASHLVTELKFNGNTVYGKAKILESTPAGKIAKGLIEDGVKIGVSSRGVGSLREENGINIVQDDFLLAAIDIVSDPSAPEAFVNGIYEGKTWVMENGLWREADLMETKSLLDNTSNKKEREKIMFEKFKAFMKEI